VREPGFTTAFSGARGQRGAVALFLGFCIALLTSACATNPATGEHDIVLMSESSEIKKGREMHEEMIKKGAAYDDQNVQAYVDKIGQDLAAHSDRPDLTYTFTVIDDASINAFAFPGGYIYINRGLMVYLDNEAELAAVLAHEIGHVTARHAVRQQTAAATNKALSQVAYVFTGSADLAQASNTYGTSLVRGYGRDHELEADSEGATYLYNSGYDPNALLEVIGVLKDQEQYDRVKANASGKKSQAYHGLFSTHPRNDKRLQQVISTASELETRQPKQVDPAEFRKVMNGLAYGKSSTTAQRQENRYYHNKLGFTFAYPEEWSVAPTSKAIVTHDAADDAKVIITIQRKDDTITTREFLDEKLNAPKLFQSTALSQAGLAGHTGISPSSDGTNRRRLAVLYSGRLAYLFEGEVTDDRSFDQEDVQFMQVIESFRPMKRSEREGKKQQYVSYVQAGPDTTFAKLARSVRIPDAANQLRLMNGYYPSGEPRAGDWIKIIKQ
jgi:predicted Zn-dependent protease